MLTEWSTPGVDIHAVFATSRYLSPNVRSFIDCAIDQSRRDEAYIHYMVATWPGA
jgi:hypothetical protein